jgi:hypothetical protein
MIDLLPVINDAAFNSTFELGSVPIQRHRDGSMSTEVNWCCLNGVVQPVTENRTQHLNEGDRFNPSIHIYCGDVLNPTWGDLPQLGDVVRWHERTYRIVESKDWSQYGFWQAIATELRNLP